MNKLLLITGLLICAHNTDVAASQATRRAEWNADRKAKAELRRDLAQQAINNLLALRRTHTPTAVELAEQFDAEEAPSAPASPVAARRPVLNVFDFSPSRLTTNDDGTPKTAREVVTGVRRLSPQQITDLLASCDDSDESE